MWPFKKNRKYSLVAYGRALVLQYEAMDWDAMERELAAMPPLLRWWKTKGSPWFYGFRYCRGWRDYACHFMPFLTDRLFPDDD